MSSVCHPGTQCVDHPSSSNNDLYLLSSGSVWHYQHYGSLYQLYFLHLPAVRSGHVPLDQQGRGRHVSSGHVIMIILFPVVILHVTQISMHFVPSSCLCLCCYCCFYNSINMMLFCHPIVSELCIMCQALFRSLQFPPKYGPWPDSNNSADGTWPTTSKWHVCIDKLSRLLKKGREEKHSNSKYRLDGRNSSWPFRYCS